MFVKRKSVSINDYFDCFREFLYYFSLYNESINRFNMLFTDEKFLNFSSNIFADCVTYYILLYQCKVKLGTIITGSSYILNVDFDDENNLLIVDYIEESEK